MLFLSRYFFFFNAYKFSSCEHLEHLKKTSFKKNIIIIIIIIIIIKN